MACKRWHITGPSWLSRLFRVPAARDGADGKPPVSVWMKPNPPADTAEPGVFDTSWHHAAEPIPVPPPSPPIDFCDATYDGHLCRLPKGHGLDKPVQEPLSPHSWYFMEALYFGPRRGPEPTSFGIAACPDCRRPLAFGQAHYCPKAGSHARANA